MTERDFLHDRVESFLRSRLAEECCVPDPPFRSSLTLSRQCGAGGDRIGRQLVEYLGEVDESAIHGWAWFDQRLIGQLVEDHRLPGTIEPFRRGEPATPLVGAIEEALDTHPSDWTPFHHSLSAIRRLCRLGNAIVVGRGGNFATTDFPNTFHVRLVGSRHSRLARVRQTQGIGGTEAERLIDQTDRARARFVEDRVGADIDDSTAYHLVLNTDDFDPTTLVRVVSDNLLEWAHQQERKQMDRPLSPVAPTGAGHA